MLYKHKEYIETPIGQTKTMTLGSSAPSPVTPDSGYALSSVSPSIDTSVIKAENIAEGATILGIAGTHSSGEQVYNITISATSGNHTVSVSGVSYRVGSGRTASLSSTLSAFFTNFRLGSYVETDWHDSSITISGTTMTIVLP